MKLIIEITGKLSLENPSGFSALASEQNMPWYNQQGVDMVCFCRKVSCKADVYPFICLLYLHPVIR